MATFKKFIAGLAIESIQTLEDLSYGTGKSAIPYKDTSGTDRSTIWMPASSYSLTTMCPYAGIIPVATNDLLDDYSVNDYQISVVGTTTYSSSRTVSTSSSTRTFAITITNSGDSPITVKCIKFKKLQRTNSNTSFDVLVCAVYLDEDEWLTIPAGEDKTIVLVMNIAA